MDVDSRFKVGHGLGGIASDGVVSEERKEALDEIDSGDRISVKCTCQHGRLTNQLRIGVP